MRKFLSIVIPRYKETEREIFPLLSSISGQVGVDFSDLEVMIVNDGGGAGALDTDFLALFGLEIRQISLEENRGPGAARQAGLDEAMGEYVMFCDADDALHSVGVLGALMQEAEKTAPDILNSSWLEELRDENGTFRYITHENENTWMHGKLLRRQFLVQNNIRFHPDLRVHEDSYFLCIAAALAQRHNHLPVTTYVWKHRADSITRRNGSVYTYESIPTFIQACTMAHQEVERRNPAQMEYKIVQFILYNYFCFHQPGWQAPDHAEYLQAAERAFAEHMKPFWHYWDDAPAQRIAEVYNQERARSFAGCVEHETVGAWLGRMRCESERKAERESERIHRKQEREAAALAEAAAAKW